ncbi:MAG: phenylalanine--tRNA ligase subunit beta [Gammaproteobacteria bacterium]|nr:phenylalanine--tRNA ligase subunit beta [Gammaproteobacteria bacterium]
MQISEAWLREWCNPPWNSRELAERLTMGGFEIEGRATAAPPFDNVVVGRVLESVRHPNADKLSLCTVTTDGSNRLSIVCGAPNARASLTVAVALPGAVLPGGVQIKLARVRDVESQGMLCSARELGMGEESDGILELPLELPLGKSVREALQLDDQILQVNVTPNRGDALSVRGLAREVAALSQVALTHERAEPVAPQLSDQFTVRLSAPQCCPKFTSRVIRGVNARAPSPSWLRERLRRAGLRSIDPIVDVTNYTMLEWARRCTRMTWPSSSPPSMCASLAAASSSRCWTVSRWSLIHRCW